jgi:hypothetical protein
MDTQTDDQTQGLGTFNEDTQQAAETFMTLLSRVRQNVIYDYTAISYVGYRPCRCCDRQLCTRMVQCWVCMADLAAASVYKGCLDDSMMIYYCWHRIGGNEREARARDSVLPAVRPR